MFLHDSGIVGFHCNGLAACQQLQAFVCYGSVVDAHGNVAEAVSTRTFPELFPASLSTLTCLTELKVEVKGKTSISSRTHAHGMGMSPEVIADSDSGQCHHNLCVSSFE